MGVKDYSKKRNNLHVYILSKSREQQKRDQSSRKCKAVNTMCQKGC